MHLSKQEKKKSHSPHRIIIKAKAKKTHILSKVTLGPSKSIVLIYCQDDSYNLMKGSLSFEGIFLKEKKSLHLDSESKTTSVGKILVKHIVTESINKKYIYNIMKFL